MEHTRHTQLECAQTSDATDEEERDGWDTRNHGERR
jgi:hypothetical protein